jgi:transcriptional regulator with XRE-family HTH domain
MSETQQDRTSRPRASNGTPIRQHGPAIRALREKDGYTQVDLAREVGMTQANLWRIENEKANARVSTLHKIARVLRVPVKTIMRELIEDDAA